MGPLTLAVDGKSSAVAYTDAGPKKAQNLSFETKKPFAAISTEAEKPFDFFRTLFEGMIAGGTAGVVVETALYPIDTIKTRLQAELNTSPSSLLITTVLDPLLPWPCKLFAAHGGGKIVLKGLYSGLAGNLAGVLPASAVFVGVYEPTKQKLLRMFPENLTAVAHLVRELCSFLDYSTVHY
ncbi:hypothetical protein L484_005174 [Morus notabilis]|uniref:S-adenosylmethionine carrier 1 n=1 Tax=Morus notabilis TaxID=981085 RepID=W9QC14_9ROSA|nr:hypothetical protein L484_005174 [Morus notabilis]